MNFRTTIKTRDGRAPAINNGVEAAMQMASTLTGAPLRSISYKSHDLQNVVLSIDLTGTYFDVLDTCARQAVRKMGLFPDVRQCSRAGVEVTVKMGQGRTLKYTGGPNRTMLVTFSR